MARGKGRDSVPAPGAELSRLMQGLSSSWPSGLTLLAGDSGYHVDRAQRALVDALVPGGGGDLSLTVFGEEKVDVAAVVGAARSRGMFSPRRVVLVRDASLLEGDPEVIEAYVKAPPPQSHLIVRAGSLDRRRKLHQALSASPLSFWFLAEGASRAEIESDVAEMVRERGLTLDRAAALWLIGVCGPNYGRLESELDKLRDWAGSGAARIGVEVVRDVTAGAGLMTGWEVAQAILAKDRGSAYAALRGLIASGKAPLIILGGIGWYSRSLLAVKARLEGGESLTTVIADLRIWHIKDEISRAVHRFALEELLGFPAALREADRTLKSSSIAPLAVLERLIDRLVTAPVWEEGR